MAKPLTQDELNSLIKTAVSSDVPNETKLKIAKYLQTTNLSGLSVPEDLGDSLSKITSAALNPKMSQQEFDDTLHLIQSSSSKVARDANIERLANADLTGLELPKGFKQPKKSELFNPTGPDRMVVKSSSSGVVPSDIQKTMKGDDFAFKKAVIDEGLAAKEAAKRAEKQSVKAVTRSLIPEVGPSVIKKAAQEGVEDASKAALKSGAKKAFAVLGGPLTQIGVPLAAAAMSGDIYAADPSGSETAGEGSDIVPGAKEYKVQPTNGRSELQEIYEGLVDAKNKTSKRIFKALGGDEPYQNVDEKFNYFSGKSPEEIDTDLSKMGFNIRENAPMGTYDARAFVPSEDKPMNTYDLKPIDIPIEKKRRKFNLLGE